MISKKTLKNDVWSHLIILTRDCLHLWQTVLTCPAAAARATPPTLALPRPSPALRVVLLLRWLATVMIDIIPFRQDDTHNKHDEYCNDPCLGYYVALRHQTPDTITVSLTSTSSVCRRKMGREESQSQGWKSSANPWPEPWRIAMIFCLARISWNPGQLSFCPSPRLVPLIH